MHIRKMRIEDYDEMYILWMSSAGIGLNDFDDSKIGIDKFLNRNPNSCFIAEIDNKIIGTILVGTDGRRGHIYHLAVAEMLRNNGIATKLVNTALCALKNMGITKVALVVFKDNDIANKFWTKSGFVEREDLIYRNRQLIE